MNKKVLHKKKKEDKKGTGKQKENFVKVSEDPDRIAILQKFKEYLKKTRRSWILLLLVFPLAIYLMFGLKHLTQFETADEYRWIYPDSRIPRYWEAMERREWKDTMVNDKPGISTAIISGLGRLGMDWGFLAARFVDQGKYSVVFDPLASETINFIFRLPLLVFNGLLAVLWYFIFRRLFENNWTALLACSLILLSPILLGISQIVNPDTLLWSTAFTAIISFILFLKYQKWYDALISGLFLGFALLSKYTTVMIIPYELALVVAYLVFSYDHFIAEGSFRKRVIQYAIFYPISVALGIFVYALLMPAVFQFSLKDIISINEAFEKIYPYLKDIGIIAGIMLVEAAILKSWVLKKILFPFKCLWNIGSRAFYGAAVLIFSLVLWNWNKGNWWGIPNVPFDAGSDEIFGGLALVHKIFLELLPFVFSLTPLVLVLLSLTWITYIFKRKPENSFVVFALTLFMPFFYFAVIQVGYLATVRYSIMLYPLVATLAAIGIVEIFQSFKFKTWVRLGIFVCAIWVSVFSLKNIQPFYFNYANDLLPKNKVIASAWGYGGYEVAQFINSQTENPKDLVVWTDYDGFCPFFSGLCVKGSDIKWIGYKTTNRVSYYVSTKRGSIQMKTTWAKLLENTNKEPVWELQIGDRPDNYIRVYSVERSDFTSDNWWREKPPEPVVNIKPSKPSKIIPSVKNSAKIIPKNKNK